MDYETTAEGGGLPDETGEMRICQGIRWARHRLDQYQLGCPCVERQPKRNAVAGHVPGVRKRIGVPQPAVRRKDWDSSRRAYSAGR